jgi:hypothetical protein
MVDAKQPIGPERSPVSPLILKAVSLAAAGGAIYSLSGGSGRALIVGVLLGIVALGVSAVLLGGGSWGPAVEGRLDLSARLGLGLLGGGLGAITSRVALWLLEAVEIPAALGVGPLGGPSGGELVAHLGTGALWGMVLGVVFHQVPARGAAARGALFSLVPSLYLLLKVYPLDYGVGVFGSGLGALTFVFVLLLNLIWGGVVGSVLGWGEEADEAPVARPIDA